MSKTLKEVYELRKLRNKIAVVDDQKVINENKRTALIMEAFNNQQMEAAIDIVKKLKSFNFGNITALAQARDNAVRDVTKTLAGNKEQGLVRKIVNLFKSEEENPLVDVLAFAGALNSFFKLFSQYVTALGVKDESQTLGSVVTGMDDAELKQLSSIHSLSSENKEKMAELQKVILQGLKPEGLLAKLGKNWVTKYMGGKQGLKQLAQDMLKMSVKDLNALTKSVTDALKNVDAVGQAAAGAAQQASTGTTSSTSGEASSSSEPSKGTGPNAEPEAAKHADAVYSSVKDSVQDVKEDDVKKVIDALIKAGKLKP
jgi:hypothetical protein